MQGSGFRVLGTGFGFQGFRGSDLRARVLGCVVERVSVFGVRSLGFKVEDLGFRV